MEAICERREELLISLLYDEGDPEELARTRAHLATCDECRQEYESLTGTRELLGAWPNVSNVPKIVYVTDPGDLVSRVRRWVNEMGGLGLKSLLRPAMATAAAFLVLVVGVSILRFEVSPEGVLQVGFGNRGATPATMAEGIPGETDGAIVPVSREEFTSAMEDMARYLDELVQNTRAQDRQFILAQLQDQLDIRDEQVTNTVLTAMNTAFTDMDTYAARLEVLTAAFDDLQYIMGSELQKMNMILASLIQGGVQEEWK